MREPLGVFPPQSQPTLLTIDVQKAMDAGDYAAAAEGVSQLGHRLVQGQQDLSLSQFSQLIEAIPAPYNSTPTAGASGLAAL